MIKPIISILRVRQWAKNAFVLLPLFFNGSLLNPSLLQSALAMALAFCLAASGIYCLNDICDRETDRQHPVKKMRPVASGTVSIKEVVALAILCIGTSISVIDLFPWQAGVNVGRLYGVILLYLLMNIAYCLWLKRIVIVDVFIIAGGFVLRIVAGGMATGIPLSHWIVSMTFLLALFLAFAKRRDDVAMFEETHVKTRSNLGRYSLAFMNQVIGLIAGITMVCYIMYTVSPEVTRRFHSSAVYVTSVFVLAGIIRYLQITIVDGKSGSPTRVLLEDRFIQTTILCWLAAFTVIIYMA